MLITVFSQFFPICFIHLWILTVMYMIKEPLNTSRSHLLATVFAKVLWIRQSIAYAGEVRSEGKEVAEHSHFYGRGVDTQG